MSTYRLGISVAVVNLAALEVCQWLGVPMFDTDPGMLGLAVVALFATIWAFSAVRKRLRPI